MRLTYQIKVGFYTNLLTLKVFEARWWACMYGAGTAKRHIAWSNSRTVQLLDLGKMIKALHAKKAFNSTRKYKSRTGKVSWCGSALLKSTQTPAMLGWWFYMSQKDPRARNPKSFQDRGSFKSFRVLLETSHISIDCLGNCPTPVLEQPTP